MNSIEKRILIVDDEEDLCEILQYNLGKAGYLTEVSYSAEEAILKPLQKFDLLLLDIMMGAMSGLELAKMIRKELKLNVPIVFLTAKDSENDILTGFNLEADDYIAKPFSINELLARVKAVLKRTQSNREYTESRISFGEIEIDTLKKRLLINDNRIELTKKEFQIIKLLLEHQGSVYSRGDLLSKVWGDDIVVSERTVDVNITRLRNKLGPMGKYIKNKSGLGYYFEY